MMIIPVGTRPRAAIAISGMRILLLVTVFVASSLTACSSSIGQPTTDPTAHPSTKPSTRPTTMPTVTPVLQSIDNKKAIFCWQPVENAAAYAVFQVFRKPDGTTDEKPLAVTPQTSIEIPVDLQAGARAEVEVSVVGPPGGSVTVTSTRVGAVPENPMPGWVLEPYVYEEDNGPIHMDLTFLWKPAENATDYLVEYELTLPGQNWPSDAQASKAKLGPADLRWSGNNHLFFKLTSEGKQPYRFRVTPSNKFGAGKTTDWRYWPEPN